MKEIDTLGDEGERESATVDTKINDFEPSAEDVQVDTVYEDMRTNELLKLVYIDEDVALFRTADGGHRFDRRKAFDNNNGVRFKQRPNETIQVAQMEWSAIQDIGPGTEEYLYDYGYKTAESVLDVTEEKLRDVPNVGKAGASRVIEHAEDVRNEQ